MKRKTILKTLSDFIAIQSVSTDTKRFSQIKQAAFFLQKQLLSLNFKTRVVENNNIPPFIIASKIISSAAPTIGIYGHYDVQPENPTSEWTTPPFKLTNKKGRFFGRGVADNKGHIIQNLSAIKELIKTDHLKNNVVLILEGEEETGSLHLEQLLKKEASLLKKIDVFYITDVGMHKKNQPQIFYGLRGLICLEIQIWTGKKDLHSGIYGNAVFNPIHILADLIAKIADFKTGKILIPNFYKDVRKPTKKEIDLLKKVKTSKKQLKKEAAVFGLVLSKKYPPYLRPKICPSFDINGLVSGHTSKGSKTIIPNSASAKLSFRLVEHQDPTEIEKLIYGFIKKTLPKEIKYSLTTQAKVAPFYTSTNNPWIKKTALILKEEFRNNVFFNRSGGSIPAAEILFRLFKKPVILTGFTLPDDNIHAPNENFDEKMFWEGIKTLKKIYS